MRMFFFLWPTGALSSTVLNVRSPSVSSTLVTSVVTRPVSSAPVIISSVNRATPVQAIQQVKAADAEFVSETEQAVADMTAEHASLPMQVDGACDDSDSDSDVGQQVDGTSDPVDGEQQAEEQPAQQQEEEQAPAEDQADAVAMVTAENEAGAEVVTPEVSADAVQQDADAVPSMDAAPSEATDPTEFLQTHDDAPQVTLAHMDAAAAMATDAAAMVTSAESALSTEAAAALALALDEVEPKEEPSEVAAPSVEMAAPAPVVAAPVTEAAPAVDATNTDGIKMEDDSEKLAGIVPMMDVSGTASAGNTSTSHSLPLVIIKCSDATNDVN